jgi:hypothetical protein
MTARAIVRGNTVGWMIVDAAGDVQWRFGVWSAPTFAWCAAQRALAVTITALEQRGYRAVQVAVMATECVGAGR